MPHYLQGVCNHHERIGVDVSDHLLESGQLPERDNRVQDLLLPACESSLASYNRHPSLDLLHDLSGNFLPLWRDDVGRFSLTQSRDYEIDQGGVDIQEDQSIKGHLQGEKNSPCQQYESVKGQNAGAQADRETFEKNNREDV